MSHSPLQEGSRVPPTGPRKLPREFQSSSTVTGLGDWTPEGRWVMTQRGESPPRILTVALRASCLGMEHLSFPAHQFLHSPSCPQPLSAGSAPALGGCTPIPSPTMRGET